MFDSKQINEWTFEYYAPLRRVKQFIRDHSAENISLGRIAQVAGMERKYFSTYFHKKVGICFRYWLMSVRIANATSIMQHDDRSITQVAFETGFRDLRTFERAFKRCTGFTPREFQGRIRNLAGTCNGRHEI
jgi:two-component system response regulator YesN